MIKTIKTSFQALVQRITLLINNPATRQRIKTTIQRLRGFIKARIKAVIDYFKSEAFKNKVSAARKWVFDTLATIKTKFIQITESERFKRTLTLFKSKTRQLIEWVINTFKRQTFDKCVALAKASFAAIQLNIIQHKRIPEAIAILLLVFLIWAKAPEQLEPSIEKPSITAEKTSITPENTSITAENTSITAEKPSIMVKKPSITPEKTSTDDKTINIKGIAPNFKEYAAGSPRKSAFFNYFAPLVEKKNKSVIKSRQSILDWYDEKSGLSDNEKRQVQSLAAYYRVNNFDLANDADWEELLIRVNVIPVSLALAQAANESAWGTSRFARKAHNYYGQWCFQKGCGLVPAKRDNDKTHEVAAFKSPEESVERYIHNLNSHNAYKTLREIRNALSLDGELISGLALAEGLTHYSERGKAYVEELQSMISFNKLSRFDK